MKSAFACLLATAAMLVSARAADVTTKITDVHLCCQACVTGAQKALSASAPSVKAVVDKDGETITLTGTDIPSVQKAADGLVKAGYFGQSSNPDIKLNADTGAKGQEVKTLDISDVHICCASCAKAVTNAVLAVPGVKATTGVVKNAKTFQVTGDFKDSDALAALQKAGLTGKVVAEK
jgi:copper chaperone CopZ